MRDLASHPDRGFRGFRAIRSLPDLELDLGAVGHAAELLRDVGEELEPLLRRDAAQPRRAQDALDRRPSCPHSAKDVVPEL